MTFSTSKSTIFVPKNTQNVPKFCVDCSAKDASYYSYGYKVFVCLECARIHDTHLKKYSLQTQLRYQCPLIDTGDCKGDENLFFNTEYEASLPDFFQKMGARTPEVIRKEYIISKYTNELFTSPSGADSLLPPQIVTLMFKRSKDRPMWHPCCVRFDKEARSLHIYSHKSNRWAAKHVIHLRDTEVFVEQLPHGRVARGESYLHFVWKKSSGKRHFTKSTKRKMSIVAGYATSDVRNFYFRPSTDSELFLWYFSVSAAKHEYVPPPPAPRSPLKRSFTFDMDLSCIGEEVALTTPFRQNRKSVCDLLSVGRDLHSPDRKPADLIDMGHNSPGFIAHEFFSSCHGNEVSQEDEIDGNYRGDSSDMIISSSFYSCHPREGTNPFITPTDIFQDQLEYCSIYDSPTPDVPPTDKSEWLCSPVRLPNVCREEAYTSSFLESVRLDMEGNRRLYQMSGWLFKVGEGVGDMWRNRWFTLSNRYVTYSENKFSPFPKNHFNLGSNQKGFRVDIALSSVNMIPPPNNHFFRLLTPTRVYHLCAISEEVRTVWIEIISRVIALSFVLK